MNSVFGADKKKCKHCGADVEDSEYSNHMIEHIRRAKAVAEYKKKLAERDFLRGKKQEISIEKAIQKRDEAAQKKAAAAEASRRKLEEAKARREYKLMQKKKPCVQPESGSSSSSRPTKSDDEVDRALKEIGSEGHKRAKRRDAEQKTNTNTEASTVTDHVTTETETETSSCEEADVSEPEQKTSTCGNKGRSERDSFVGVLVERINWFRQAAVGDPKYDHIDVSEREKILNECSDAEIWLRERQELQDGLPKHAEAVLLSADIRKKTEAIERVCRLILSKPKTAPKPTTPEQPASLAAAPTQEGEQQHPAENDEGGWTLVKHRARPFVKQQLEEDEISHDEEDTGLEGERVAFEYFSDLYKDKTVVWVNKIQESGKPFDILVEGKDNSKNYIEVKTTRIPAKDWFEISFNEWQFAMANRDSYTIARVNLLLGGKSMITTYSDPVKFFQSKELRLLVQPSGKRQPAVSWTSYSKG